MPWVNGGAFWIGRHETLGLIVIVRDAVLSNSSDLAVFSVDQDRVVQGRREFLREFTVGSALSQSDVELAVESFKNFPLRQRQAELDAKNKAFLERLGKAFAGTRPRSPDREVRATHCYACAKQLKSDVEFECSACSWLLCDCGACGCGYQATKFATSNATMRGSD